MSPPPSSSSKPRPSAEGASDWGCDGWRPGLRPAGPLRPTAPSSASRRRLVPAPPGAAPSSPSSSSPPPPSPACGGWGGAPLRAGAERRPSSSRCCKQARRQAHAKHDGGVAPAAATAHNARTLASPYSASSMMPLATWTSWPSTSAEKRSLACAEERRMSVSRLRAVMTVARSFARLRNSAAEEVRHPPCLHQVIPS